MSKHHIVGLLDVGVQHKLEIDLQVDLYLEYHVGEHFF